jgi:hypothetical protein
MTTPQRPRAARSTRLDPQLVKVPERAVQQLQTEVFTESASGSDAVNHTIEPATGETPSLMS